MRFGRQHRLTRAADIERVRRTGRSCSVGPLVLLAALGEVQAPARVAIIAGKKIGGSVERNLVKRRLREAFREQLPYIRKGWDLLLIARPSIARAEFRQIEAALNESLRRAHLYEETGAVGHKPVSEDH